MTHEDLVALLPDLLAERLPRERRLAAEEHLAACPDCRALSGTWELLTTILGRDRHPEADDLARLVTGHGEAEGGLAMHLEDCASCRDELVRARRADAAAPRDEPVLPEDRREPASWPRWGALAAGLVAALLLWPAYLGLVRLPDVRGRLADMQQEAAARPETSPGTGAPNGRRDPPGAARFHLLGEPLRGDPETVLRIGPGEPYVVLGVDLRLPDAVDDAREIVFAVAGAGGPAATVRRTAGRVRGDLDGPGVVTLLIPSPRLPAGSYRLEVSVTGEPGTLLTAPFRVEVGDA